MIFLSEKNLLNLAKKDGVAVGAFNTSNLEITQAIALAAKETGCPIIIQTTPSAIDYAGLEQIFDIVRNEVDEPGIEATLHLDHGKDFGIIKECIDIGYPSVMIDGSRLDYEENIYLTRKVANYAKRYNVSVEGELGVISHKEGGKKSGQAVYTDPKIAEDFVQKTGIDSLAVSVGNEHGAPKGEKLDLGLLEKIAQVVSVPLVMHGASGLSRLDIRKAIKFGVTKFNIDTQIKKAFSDAMKSGDKEEIDPREMLEVSKDAAKHVVKDYITLFSTK